MKLCLRQQLKEVVEKLFFFSVVEQKAYIQDFIVFIHVLTAFQCSSAGLNYFLGLRNVSSERICVQKVDKHLQEMTIPS